MLNRVVVAMQAQRAAVREAEALVYWFGSRGIEMARTNASDQSVTRDRQAHYRRVARIAERRHLGLMSLDTATRYCELDPVGARVCAAISNGPQPVELQLHDPARGVFALGEAPAAHREPDLS
jgi:hypothetical protein